MEQQNFMTQDAGVTNIELITPEIAKTMLERNAHNRRVSGPWVDELSRRILSAMFVLTHEGIAFAVDGTLIDGQHRLLAIIKAGRPVLMRVTRGLPRSAQWVIDSGRVRRVGDEIDIHDALGGSTGPQVGKDKQAIAQMLSLFIEGMSAATLADSLRTLEHFSAAVDFVLGGSFIKGITVAPVRAAVVLAYNVDPSRVREFYTSLLSGANLPEFSPILALRNMCINDNPRVAKYRSAWARKRVLFLRTAKAVDYHLSGETTKCLKESRASFEAFARFNGLTPIAKKPTDEE